ncbi:putative GMP synthase [glutamine-hydrolyzing] [Bienertia sinuspersici]
MHSMWKFIHPLIMSSFYIKLSMPPQHLYFSSYSFTLTLSWIPYNKLITYSPKTYRSDMCHHETKQMSTSLDGKFSRPVDGRPILQPTCNHLDSIKKFSPKTPPPPPPPPPPRATTITKTKPANSPTSPKLRSPRPPAVKRGSESNALNSSSDKITLPKTTLTRSVSTLERKKSKKWTTVISKNNGNDHVHVAIDPPSPNYNVITSYSSSLLMDSPGSVAAVRREQMALQTAQRKMKIAHYGRSKSAKFSSNKVSPLVQSLGNINTSDQTPPTSDRRCTSVTPNSDPLCVAYHDEEWGVPVHDDKMLFELLVLSSAQVGSDWASILRRRQNYRKAFSEFDPQVVANFTEKQMTSISTHYAFEISRVRGVVDNAKRIIEIKKEFGSFDKYIWGFVNNKPISPQYKFAYKIPVKTSKSESISKDMVRRGFRTVGPTAVHSFMEAAGLTNDHLITCYRHLECTALATTRPLTN